MGIMCPPFYGNKKSKFYENKIKKAKAIIEKQNEIIAECEKQMKVEDARTQIKN